MVVGLNEYRPETVQPLEVFEYDTREEERQVKRLRETRKRRSNAAVETALADVKRHAEADQNLLPPVLAAVKVSATEGEVMDALREVYGEYRDPGVL